jgi:hypothetical protein
MVWHPAPGIRGRKARRLSLPIASSAMNIQLVTYINLPHRREKNGKMVGQLLGCGIPFYRTEGVVPENFRDYRVPEYLRPGSTRHKGTVGCYLAHRRAVADLESKCASPQFDKDGQVMIFEDDVSLSETFWPHIRTLGIPDDCDMVFFDNSHKNGTSPDPGHLVNGRSDLWFIHTGWPAFFGAYAYVIPIRNLSRIRHILDNPPNGLYWDVDGYYIENTTAYSYRTNRVRVTCGISDRNPDNVV